jgi:hypothetical protein
MLTKRANESWKLVGYLPTYYTRGQLSHPITTTITTTHPPMIFFFVYKSNPNYLIHQTLVSTTMFEFFSLLLRGRHN